MIEFLKISSLAIFDEIEIEFEKGLNCITGETGAGKSLIIDALSLLLGARTSSDIIRPGRDKAVIEALFITDGKEYLLKREITSTGRSRSFINGELSTTEQLSKLTSGLVHIYGQHQYQDLLSPLQQMRMLEEFAEIKRDEAVKMYAELEGALERLQDVKREIEDGLRQRHEIEFTVAELKDISVKENEEEELSSDLKVLQSVSELKHSALHTLDILYTGSPAVLDMISEVKSEAAKIASLDLKAENILEPIEQICIQIEDISRTLRELSHKYEFDPEKFEELNFRLHRIRDLKRKYRCDEKGLIELLKDSERKLGMIEDSAGALSQIKKEFGESLKKYSNVIAAFLDKRKKAGDKISKLINKDLKELGMTGTQFTVFQGDSILPAEEDEASVDGISPGKMLSGEFMISTNVGQNMHSLAKIASGGELSRIMLALKIHQKTSAEATMIFDEIDSGISGQTAIIMADKLREIAAGGQAIIITHLHQAAAFADSHVYILKEVVGKETFAKARRITGEERVTEIARMMGGENPSPTVIKHARELLK